MKEQVYILKDVVRYPVKAFKRISEKGRDFLLGAVVIVVLSVTGHLLLGEFRMPLVIVEWPILVACLYAIGKLLKGKARFVGLLSAIGYAHLPGVFSPMVMAVGSKLVPGELIAQIEAAQGEEAMALLKQLFTPAFTAVLLVIVVMGIWSFALYILALRESHGFSTWRAFVTLMIGGALLLVITSLIRI